MRYFTVVAEQLHFGRAAEILHIGQPAVSQQIQRLERELGVVLFDRTSRTVQLTEAGQRFLPEARAVLAAADRARDAAVSLADPRVSRVLRLGTSTGLGDRLDAVLATLGRLAPDVSVELINASTRARLGRVRAGQLDAAFVRGAGEWPGLRLIPVWDDEIVAAVPADHRLAGAREVALADLAPLPLRLVSRRLNQPLVDLVIGACAQAGFEPRDGPAVGRLAGHAGLDRIGFAVLDGRLRRPRPGAAHVTGDVRAGAWAGAAYADGAGRARRGIHGAAGPAAARLP